MIQWNIRTKFWFERVKERLGGEIENDTVTTNPYVTNNVSAAKTLDEAICGNAYGNNGDAAKAKSAH